MNKDKKMALLRLVAVIIIVTGVVLAVFMFLKTMMPGLIEAIESGKEDAIEDYLRSSDRFWGIVSLFLLQYIQILSIFLPGAPIQIASGIVFGTWIGFLTCYIAYNLANLTLFFLTRKLGDSIRQIIARDRPKDSSLIEKILASPAIGVILLCLIPIVPNGLVPVFASRTNITYRKFILSVAVGSIPTLLVLAAVGNHLLMGDYFTSIILCIILGTVAGMVYLNQNRIIEMVADFESRIGIGSQNDNTQDKDQN